MLPLSSQLTTCSMLHTRCARRRNRASLRGPASLRGSVNPVWPYLALKTLAQRAQAALVAHLKRNPEFFAGLDVFEDEPEMAPGLAECSNAVIVPHIASASLWTRAGMATLAAANVAGRLRGAPAFTGTDVLPWVDGPFEAVPAASPSIVNAKDLGLETTDRAA